MSTHYGKTVGTESIIYLHRFFIFVFWALLCRTSHATSSRHILQPVANNESPKYLLLYPATGTIQSSIALSLIYTRGELNLLLVMALASCTPRRALRSLWGPSWQIWDCQQSS